MICVIQSPSRPKFGRLSMSSLWATMVTCSARYPPGKSGTLIGGVMIGVGGTVHSTTNICTVEISCDPPPPAHHLHTFFLGY